MAKTLITTPFPEPADLARKLGISRKRFRELEALAERIMARSDKRKASRTSVIVRTDNGKRVAKKRA